MWMCDGSPEFVTTPSRLSPRCDGPAPAPSQNLDNPGRCALRARGGPSLPPRAHAGAEDRGRDGEDQGDAVEEVGDPEFAPGQLQAGFTLGGAIKKNKLFYFLSFETEQRSDEASSYVAQNSSNVSKTNTSRVLESDLQAVSAILKRGRGE